MARWEITVSGKGIRKAGIEKLAAKLKEEYGEGAVVGVVDATQPESRAERFSTAQSLISDARCEMESLRDELQEWLDTIPENLQSGDKYQQIETSIASLEDIIGELENQEGADVEFPSMMG